jgi:acetylglutamate kinase
VIKIGGSTLADLQPAFFTSLQKKIQKGEKFVIVHGGGPEINKRLELAGLPIQIKDGIRITSSDTLSCVKVALKDVTNANLVARLTGEGIPAIGLCGSESNLIQCEYLDKKKYGFVGKVMRVNTDVLENLMNSGKVPVIASLGMTETGDEVNINADTVAGETAAALSAISVCFVTDTSGIHLDGVTANKLSVAQLLQGMNDGHIYGGMVPKVEAAMKCLDLDIEKVVITDQTLTGTTLFKEAVSS